MSCPTKHFDGDEGYTFAAASCPDIGASAVNEYPSSAMMKAANVAEGNSWLTKNAHLVSVGAKSRHFSRSAPTEVHEHFETLLVER